MYSAGKSGTLPFPPPAHFQHTSDFVQALDRYPNLRSMASRNHGAGQSSTSQTSPASVVSTRSKQARKRSQASLASPVDVESTTERVNRRRSKKTTRACDFCKSKKLKCSGSLPCDGCNKRRLTCVYASEYRRGRPPTPPLAETSLLPPAQ